MNNWKDKLREMYFVDSSMHAEHEAFVESLLEEQRKDNEILVNTILSTKDEQLEIQAIAIRTDLINQILLEAPEEGIQWMQEGRDKDKKGYTEGFNQANQLWRELLTKHLI